MRTSTMTNERRAAYGRVAILAGAPDNRYGTGDEEVIDAITNILHACNAAGGDPFQVCEIAQQHLEDEIEAELPND